MLGRRLPEGGASMGGQSSEGGGDSKEECSFAEYSEYPLDEQSEVRELKVATFWKGENERDVVDWLGDQVARYFQWAPLDRENREVQQLSLKEVLEDDGLLPDAFQANGGSDVLQWIDPDDPSQSQLCPLDSLDQRNGWRERYFTSTIRPSTCQGTLYALPLGVHRLNMLFFNRELVAQLTDTANEEGIELASPDELEDAEQFIQFLTTIVELQEEEPGPAPLALGNKSSWPITILAFENLLAAQPREAYERLWAESSTADENEELRWPLENLIDELRALAPTIDTERSLSWQEAMGQVASGEAYFTVMGDWAWIQIPEEQRGRVAAIPFPGTADTFVYTPDSFSIPRRSDSDGLAAHYWLNEIVDNDEVQVGFANKKRSVPALKGLSEERLEDLDPPLRETYREFDRCQEPTGDCRLLLAVSGLGPPPVEDPCFDQVGDLLVRAAGMTFPPNPDAEDRVTPADECGSPVPEDPEDAAERLIEQLLKVSSKRFAEACR